MRFAGPDDAGEALPPAPWLQLSKADWMRLSETGMITVAVLLALLFVLRPLMLRLALQPQGMLAGGGGTALAGMPGGMPGGMMTGALAGDGPAGSIAGSLAGDGAALSGPLEEELVMLANVEGGLRASSVQRVSALVESHPQESLDLLRGWMVEEER